MNKSSVVVNARFLTQPITGTQRVGIELCTRLKHLLPDVVFLTPHNIQHPKIAEEIGATFHGRTKGYLWEQLEMPQYLRSQGSPLLVNLCNTAPIVYRNKIVTVLDLSFHLHPEWFSKKFSLLYNFTIPRIVKSAHKVLTISEASLNDLATHYHVPRSALDIVYPSISDIFRHPPATKGENPYGKYILAVSSLDPRKNFRGLIQAFQMAKFQDTKLVIVGAAHKVFADTGLKEMIQNDPSIIFTGYISDEQLVNLYQHALFFAYPSFFEGFGIPPLEAMSCGCATLVSDTTSLPEVCGDASVYVDPYDVAGIRDGLIKLYADEALRKTLIEKGRGRVERFSWQQSAEKLAGIITRLNP
ncbi:glycosyltransferase family 4 protein [Larkinella soli]|uniref:glycosyltransferase family 4 protein n=1 Tax=Larkinella soli TaxID=1770527 RepID=UPI000FFBD75E|nr:glycosyltransferase family 1 protein [Larkinella soli]